MIDRDGEFVLPLAGPWWFAIADGCLPVGDGSAGALAVAGVEVRPASVPGCVELDLLAQGAIEDPFVGMNIVGLRWLERKTIYYGTTFEVPEPVGDGGEPILVFEGIDCDATVYLNGRPVLESRNMLIEHVAPVGDVLRPGAPNVLCVELRPVVERARSLDHEYPPGLVAEGSGFEGLYVRKAPHMFGWDIMPRAVSAGLWRPVSLRFRPRERLDWAWLETVSLGADGTAELALHYRALTAGGWDDLEIDIHGSSGDSTFTARRPLLFDAGVVPILVDGARRWWPRGRGDQSLYEVAVRLLRGGRAIDGVRLRHGIRTVGLERTSVTDEAGSGQFRFVVNGEPLFVLGTNWVPLDAYHSRDAARLAAVLDAVTEIGCNMIRCWGGNVYESDAFFDACDERGILVWQDFAMACAIYPQDDAFQAELRREVRAVVRRLRQHPCLALWAGDNECDQKRVRVREGLDPDTNVLTRGVIPGVLREEDPSRPYLPSSPLIDRTAAVAGERYLPEDHLWGPRYDAKAPYFTESLAHFASEIGFMGAPAVSSLRRFLTPGRLWPYAGNPEWLLHATSPLPGLDVHDYRVDLMARQIRALFGSVPDSLEDFVLASQLAQAEFLKFVVDRFRAGKWRRTGIIWWNIADGWPQFSDALVDYYGVRKLAFEVLRQCQAPIAIVVGEPESGWHQVAVVNDRREPASVSYAIRDLDSGGVVLRGATTVPGDAVAQVGAIAATPDRRYLTLEWNTGTDTDRGHYLAGPRPFDLRQLARWAEADGLPIPR